MLTTLGVLALSAGTLEEDFRNPPDDAKPHTWYHMMNGNVTQEGITRDFEAIAEIGLGGVQMFDAGCDVPEGPVVFNSPGWFAMMKHAAREARRLGLEIVIPNCSGWSSSGGPWNAPSNGMKTVTFRETRVKGPRRFTAKLPREKKDYGYYEDIGVFACRVPLAESASFPDVKTELDGASCTLVSARPFELSGVSFRLAFDEWAWSAGAECAIEASDDGTTFRPLMKTRVSLYESGHVDRSRQFRSFPKREKVRAVRMKFTGFPVKVVEAHPERRARVASLEGKTFRQRQSVRFDAAETEDDQVIRRDEVLDVTKFLQEDGTFTWNVPAGEWMILRFGSLCNGAINHPASQHGCGLEVDKFSASAMDYHFEQYVGRLCRELGPLAGLGKGGLKGVLIDSYEVKAQNWTQAMEREFERRCGYSLRPFLPTFAGYVVDSAEETERFLEDFRRTVADLFAENYAGALTRKCHEYGLESYIEPYGSAPADNPQYGEYADVPMTEFWSDAGDPYKVIGGCPEASVAHVWGRRFCASESFTAHPGAKTGRWLTTPFSLKTLGDSAFAAGINRIIYHRFTHQPWAKTDYLPGMTMGRWGMHFDRTQTWWSYAKPWIRYQTRCQALLQRGVYKADVLFFSGEQAPSVGRVRESSESWRFYDLPKGYAGDVTPVDALLRLKVEAGNVVVPGGVSYRVLALPPMDETSPRVLEKLIALRKSGASIAWPRKPLRAPGLRSGADGDARVRRLADELWALGVFEGTPVAALEQAGVEPDLRDERGAGARPEVKWIHRGERDADWYFVAQPNPREAYVALSFRQTGRVPELWDAESGEIADAPVWREENGRTFVTVPMTICGSKFVVFRRLQAKGVREHSEDLPALPCGKLEIVKATYGAKAADGKPARMVDVTANVRAQVKNGALSARVGNALAGCDPANRVEKSMTVDYRVNGESKHVELAEGQDLLLCAEPVCDPSTVVKGPWRVTFTQKVSAGADEVWCVNVAALKDWATFDEPFIRYFSGTAVYAKTVGLDHPLGKDERLELDLGEVKHFAEVTVNGKTYPALWKPPFRVEISDAVPAGAKEVRLRIAVANLWANRLIGDDREREDDCTWRGTVKNGVKEIGIREIPEWVKKGVKSPTGRRTFTTWKHWDKNDALQPSGLLGPVTLKRSARRMRRR